jgi:pimeloyl-ACP methyl ester carboxylesterase
MTHATATRAPRVLDATHCELDSPAGTLGYYVAGQGAPLLLFHSINAAASAYELHSVFDHARAARTVYAFDLPGFGTAERSPRRYDIALYVRAVTAAIDHVAAAHPARAIDAMALSLGCEFLAAAAVARRDRLRSLALVSPTGFDQRSATREPRGRDDLEVTGLHAVLSAPLLGRVLFRALTTHRAIGYFLRRAYGSDRVAPPVIENAWRNARVPGASHAPLAFLCGRLFNANPQALYAALELPIWVAQPTRGDFRDFSGADWARARPNWSFDIFSSGALPQLETPTAFLQAWDAFQSRLRDAEERLSLRVAPSDRSGS